ncbi:MAG: glycogen debranching protein GlgX, partial [Promicromonosporaceae bacterium]|nr:glycogen debranching protein GlgX [Promicromonosporaceae bacterium]
MQTWPGDAYPLGATFDGSGTNFALYSEVAQRVELCLLGANGRETRVEMPEIDAHVWHAFIPGVGAGTKYGYRVYGPWNPQLGQRCDPSKLLLDPYAKAIDGQIDGDQSLFSYDFAHPDSSIDSPAPFAKDSAAHTMWSVVVNPYFDWGSDKHPRTAYCDSIIYECHVKGMTEQHPDIHPEIRGTYTAMAHPAIIEHLQKIGVTAVELMPIHQFVNDPTLVSKGLSNYWGYNTIGFFAPHNGYAAYGTNGEQVREFQTMVRALHDAGIEVILDVVYNHTAEGNNLGPTLSFRGIDNNAYYRLVDGDRAHYFDTTGTGNSLLMRSPAVLQLIMDSLRYWVTEMHVDGFRFDLAATLARQFAEVDKLSAFFDIVHQDPVISQVKLIAEPWDLGDGGYQVGGFPPLWAEWNGKYRDTVRDFWRGQPATLPEFASRITGSSDLYEHTGRKPGASINFVTAHDGFTLNDLVSYNQKHNEANGEDNRDGESHNRSWNCGAEGPTTDPEILELRARQRRNFLATLLLSQGVPMLSHGDEIARTQNGNNNVYCQDNALSWMPWAFSKEQKELLEFARQVANLRKSHRVLHRRSFFGDFTSTDALNQESLPEADWFDIHGQAMQATDWNNATAKYTTLFLNGDALPETDNRGNPLVDDSFLLLFNAHYQDVEFTLPSANYGSEWLLVLDTNSPVSPETKLSAGAKITLAQRSMVAFVRPPLHTTAQPAPHTRKVIAGAIPRLRAFVKNATQPALALSSAGKASLSTAQSESS